MRKEDVTMIGLFDIIERYGDRAYPEERKAHRRCGLTHKQWEKKKRERKNRKKARRRK